MVKKGSLGKTLMTSGKVKGEDQSAVSKKTCRFVESRKHEEEIKKTILKWRDIKVQKQRQNVPTKLHRDFIDFVHKETLFEEKHSCGLSERASPRKTSKADKEEGKKTAQERKIEIQKQREMARLQIDQMKDSAGFNDNMEAQITFRTLIRGFIN